MDTVILPAMTYEADIKYVKIWPLAKLQEKELALAQRNV